MTSFTVNPRLRWLIFIGIALVTLITYVLTALNAGQGDLLMPLDDVYIHFQYARQMALGHPYQYNLIDPPTSGATSLLYPYLLTIGYLIGFQGLWLGLWAMIMGAVALVIAQWAVYRLCDALDVPHWLSLITAMTFGISGSIAWHFMSGMETGIAITLTLLTLLFVVEKRLIPFLIVSTLLTITRPEGGLVATIAAGTLFLRLWHDYGAHQKRPARRTVLLLLAIPILAIGLQPLVNLLITGTTVATGAQAKSILSTVPQDMSLIISRIWDNFSRMWLEFATGYDAREGRGWYLPLATGAIGLLAIPILLTRKNFRLIGLMLLGWLLVSTAAVSTLDNAFWHFKRYQMPMIALFFPLSAWVICAVLHRFQQTKIPVYIYSGIIMPIFAILLAVQFQHYHAMNVSYVYQQPFQMATWLRENTPEDAVVAVHDVGLMRYHGERSTLDMVGLTTPGAAAYWRNGPGSVAEFLINTQPDYIASYGRGHGYGLAYLEDTSLYENVLAEFVIDNWQPHLNVALAADKQGIYKTSVVADSYWEGFLQDTRQWEFVDEYVAVIDVADIESEEPFNYEWSNIKSELNTFATEVREFVGICEATCTVLGSGRLITEYEQFTVQDVDPSVDLMLDTRLHTAFSGDLQVFANDTLVDTQVLVSDSGHFGRIRTQIPASYLAPVTTIRLVPILSSGQYIPYAHLLYQEPITDNVPSELPLAVYQQDAMQLHSSLVLVNGHPDSLIQPEQSVGLDLVWYSNGMVTGDYRIFVHVYDDPEAPPVAQYDGYPTDGFWLSNHYNPYPPGNWIKGVRGDQIHIDVNHLERGTYQLAIGFYNPNDPTDRLIPESDVYEVTDDGRLWLVEVEID